jgi:pimeloyl-ACP methyl ester carboxylesterase
MARLPSSSVGRGYDPQLTSPQPLPYGSETVRVHERPSRLVDTLKTSCAPRRRPQHGPRHTDSRRRRRHLTSGAINLDTHIQDVVNTFEIEGIDDAALVGHSYGGVVITGVSSRLPGRIRSLLYIDELLPQDGQSAWDLIIEPLRRNYLATTEDGLTQLPPPELGKRVPPHPLATYFQPLRLAPSTFAVRHKVYVWAQDNPQAGTFEPIYHRLADAADWQTDKLPHGRDLVAQAGTHRARGPNPRSYRRPGGRVRPADSGTAVPSATPNQARPATSLCPTSPFLSSW